MHSKEIWSKNMGQYIIKKEVIEPPGGQTFEMIRAYTLDGNYIGEESLARKLCVQYGIKPEKAHPGHGVCSIGFSEKEQKWYGWSHRGIYGFGIGSTVRNGDILAESGKFPAGYKAQSLAGAKQMAIAFANEVS